MPKGFHPIADLAQREAVGANTRRFMGEGTLFLKVPGLKTLHAVAQGGVAFPEKRLVRYPVDLSNRLEEVELDLFHHTHLPDGTPILMRSLVSNDGYFQSQVPWDVTGEWDDAVPAPEPEPPAPPVVIRKGQR